MASSRRDFLRAAAAISGGSLTMRAGTAVAGGVPSQLTVCSPNTVSPWLEIPRGTGSPLNPIALF